MTPLWQLYEIETQEFISVLHHNLSQDNPDQDTLLPWNPAAACEQFGRRIKSARSRAPAAEMITST